MLWGVVFIITIVVFFIGKNKNDEIAQKWKRSISEIVSNNFAHFGF